MCIKPASFSQRGVTLIELIVFIVIISTALTGILLVMNQVTVRSADPLVHKQALAIAESMLEEVQLQQIAATSCTGALGANAARAGAGCVSDYSGYSTTAGILDFSTNAAVAGLEAYNITSVAVTPIASLGGMPINAGSGVSITVTVAEPMGDTLVATGYRAGN